jgi:tetratricopeptide (TPR) repeat protein
MKRCLLVLLLAFAPWLALAEEGGPVALITGMDFAPADEHEGSQHRETVQALFASTDPLPDRWTRLKPVLSYCDRFKTDAATTWVSVSNEDERKLFAASKPAGTNIKLVDIACPWAYMAAAFFRIEEQDAPGALAQLDRIDELAPYMGWSRTERGFVLNATGKRQEAMASYREALKIAREHPTSAYAEPVALRGIGWTLVELGDLKGARAAYVESQKIDPKYEHTQAEIDYIDGLLEKKGPAPDSGAFGLAGVPKSSEVQIRELRKYVEALEADPFAADAWERRSALVEWMQKSPDVDVTVCNSLDLMPPPQGETPAYGSELLVQAALGNALWQLENPGAKDSVLGQQAAGARSALKAYAAIRAKHPEVHFEVLDGLLGHEAPGQLEEILAPRVRKECVTQPVPSRDT